MAVRLADYYKRYKIRSLLLLISLQLVVAVGLSLLLIFRSSFLLPDELFLPLIIALFILSEVGLSFVAFSIIGEPAQILSTAITHVSKQPNDAVPPRTNSIRHQKSGLSDMVQTVYELAANSPVEGEISNQNGAAASVYEKLFSAMPCGVIVLDDKRNVLFANQLAPVIEDSNGKQHIQLEFQQDDTLDEWLKECESHKINAKHTWQRIANRAPGTDERRIFDIIATYQKKSPSKLETIIMTVDRTSSYAPDEENMDFIALAAHELRGPITIIKGYLDILIDDLEPTLQPEQKALMERLSVSANRLSGYINNILNSSKFDRRHLKLHLHEESIEGVYKAVADDLELRASTQNRLLSATFDSKLPTVAADKNSIAEAITNLVDNAIKYSPEGGHIIVSAKVEGNFVACSVQDHGIGIPGAIVQKLFSKFYRSHRSRESTAGSGLGLYITKAIIESHGGSISVKSKEGEGSTFTFLLPIYSTVADKLRSSNNSNTGIIESSNGWIKNHAMYRG